MQHERGPRKPRLKESLVEHSFSLHPSKTTNPLHATVSVATTSTMLSTLSTLSTLSATSTATTSTATDRLPFELPILQQQNQQQLSVKSRTELMVPPTPSAGGAGGIPLHLSLPFHLWPTLHLNTDKTTTSTPVSIYNIWYKKQ